MDPSDANGDARLATAKRPRPSPLRWVVILGVLGFVLLVFMVLAKFGQVSKAQRAHEARMDALISELNPPRPAPTAAPVDEIQRLKLRIRALEDENRRLRAEGKVAPPPTPPDRGVRKPSPRDRDTDATVKDRLVSGLRELRSGRIAQAEAHFFRAVPQSSPYLLLSSLIRGDYREAMTFLARSAKLDPHWYRKIAPRAAFGSEEAYLKVLAALEARVRENPLDGEAKTLLAFLYYHDKGANYAKALLVEATSANPDLEEAKDFLESLEP